MYRCVCVSLCVYFSEITLRWGSGSCSFYGEDVLLLWQTRVRLSDETPASTSACMCASLPNQLHKLRKEFIIIFFCFMSICITCTCTQTNQIQRLLINRGLSVSQGYLSRSGSLRSKRGRVSHVHTSRRCNVVYAHSIQAQGPQGGGMHKSLTTGTSSLCYCSLSVEGRESREEEK